MRPDVFLDRAASLLEHVWASSLTRVLTLVGRRDSEGSLIRMDSPFAVISAFQSDLDLESNMQRTMKLETALDRAGIKSYRINGYWEEAPEGSSFEDASVDQALIRIKETALFCVPKSDVSFDDFETVLIRQGSRFQQIAIIIGSGKEPPDRVNSASTVWLRYDDGRIKSLPDTMNVDALQNAYKEMRGQKEHPFKFE